MKKNLITIFISLLLTTVLFYFLFKPVIEHPNRFLYSKSADALKSYFNFTYYLKFDDGIKHDGINYPYGDHLQYINSHPLYVQVIKFIDKNVYPVANYGVGILNLIMIISLILAIPFLFLILRHYSLPRWYAAIMSVIILFLTPQLDRIHGHFEMVYAFFLPMFWYLIIRWRQGEKRILWSTLLILAGLVGGFTSAYYVSFYAIFLFGILFVEIWNNRKNLKSFWKTGLSIFLLAIIPLIIVRGLVSMTDWVTDRPNNPYGFDLYHSTFLSIFLPFTSQLKQLLGNFIDMNFEWEGRAYVGLPATILAVSIFIMGFLRLFSKKKINWRLFVVKKSFSVYFFAAILILLFSMCIPFKYGFNFLLDILPPIKQFRALGRFSWIFYYVFTIYTSYFFYRLYRLLRLKSMPLLGSLLLFFVIAYWASMQELTQKTVLKNVLNVNDKFEYLDTDYLAQFSTAGVQPDEFQGILFLPFASTCGDKLLFQNGMNAFSEAMKYSLHTGIPLVQSFSPRLSFEQALSSIQLLADTAIQKVRLNDMNDKPLLLVCTKEILNTKEKWVKSKANVFWEDENITLSKLPVSVFRDSYQNWRTEVKQKQQSLAGNGNILTDSTTNNFIYNDFEENEGEYTLSGKGAFYAKKGDFEILNKKLDDNFSAGNYELSFWLYVDSRHYDMPKATLIITNPDNSRKETRLNTREVHNVYNHWIRVAQTINLQPESHIQLKIRGDYISVDDLLLRPVGSSILVKTSSNMELFNNFPYIN